MCEICAKSNILGDEAVIFCEKTTKRRKNEKRDQLESKKNTIEICDALCSDGRIEDTGSHRLKITERDRKTSSRKCRQSRLHCAAAEYVQFRHCYPRGVRDVYNQRAERRESEERLGEWKDLGDRETRNGERD